MNFPSKAFLIATIGVLTLGVVAFAFLVYYEAHTIAVQRKLMLEMFQYIVRGCPLNQ